MTEIEMLQEIIRLLKILCYVSTIIAGVFIGFVVGYFLQDK